MTESEFRRPVSACRAVALLCAIAIPSQADAGIPMLAIAWPGMFLALIPVVLIEAWVLKPRLCLTMRKALKLASVANLASTVVGVPIAWGVYLALQLGVTGSIADRLGSLGLILGAAWIGPVDFQNWIIPAATLSLFPGFFLASWVTEFKLLSVFLPEISGKTVRSAGFRANVASYAG